MTNAEKKAAAEFRKEMKEKGILPPDKPRLNRKKFIEETERAWKERPNSFVWDHYIVRAVHLIMTQTEKRSTRPSLEAVGAAKVLATALRLQEFNEKLKKEGRSQYTVGELYEYVRDILEA
jgi:hypothetical protein